MGKLDGQIALITDASDGIGFATAQCFIYEGAEHVFITGRRQEKLDEAVKKIGTNNVTVVQGDTSNMAGLDKLFEIIRQQKGRLDIIFANAGICQLAPFGTITEKHFDDTFNINVKGVLFTVQKALPPRGKRRISYSRDFWDFYGTPGIFGIFTVVPGFS